MGNSASSDGSRGGWDEAVDQNLEAGFVYHAFDCGRPQGPALCSQEVSEGINVEEFQDFHRRPQWCVQGIGCMDEDLQGDQR